MKHLLTYFKNMDPTSSENVGSNYSLGQEWYNTITGDKFYHKSDGVWVKSITGVSSLIIEVTYGELDALKTNSFLIPGRVYLLTDYMTTYTQPVTSASKSSGVIEPLYIMATAVNGLSNECKSELYPQDIVYYDITDNTEGFTKGKIYRRIDTLKNNDIGTDWRHIKYNRSGTDKLLFEDPTGCTNNTIKMYTLMDSVAGNYFRYNNIGDGFQSNTIGDGFSTNTIGNDFGINTIEDSFQSNTIGDGFNTNTIGDAFYSNTIGDGFSTNTIGDSFQSNTIGNAFYSNTIGIEFGYNNIGDSFQSNTIEDSFNSNTIGVGFHSNTIGDAFYANTIGINFNSNTIGNGFSGNSGCTNFGSNTIGNDFSTNTIGVGFQSNTIGVNFISNTIGDNSSLNVISGNFNFNTIGNNFNSNHFNDDLFTFNIIRDEFNTNIIGSNFSFNTIEPYFASKDLTTYTELYYKTYTHFVYKLTSGSWQYSWKDSYGDTIIEDIL